MYSSYTRPSNSLDCPQCGVTHKCDRDEDGIPELQVWRCQGALPDLCTEQMCSECKTDCPICDLPMCPDHARTFADGTDTPLVMCANCYAEIVEEARREAVTVELAPRLDAELVATLAAAGASIEETRAYAALREKAAS